MNRKLYAKDNAEAALGLVALHEATGAAAPLELARGAMARVLAGLDSARGLRHRLDGTADEPIHLIDHALAGRALLALEQADPAGRARWLAGAQQIAKALDRHFLDPKTGGYFDVAGDRAATGVFARRIRSLEPNAAAARFLLSLAARLVDPAPEERALRVIRAVSTSDTITQHWRYGGGLLLAVEQALRPYVHIKVGGDPAHAGFAAAQQAARRLARGHPHVVWSVDPARAQGAPAFQLCGRAFCDAPFESPGKLRPAVEAIVRARSKD